MEEALKALALYTNRASYRPSSSLRPLNGYTPVNFSKDFFHEIEEIKSTNNKISFIDGGNTSIFKSPSLCIHFIRIANIIYENNIRLQSDTCEFFLLIKAKYNHELKYEAKAFFLDNNNKTNKKTNNINTNNIEEIQDLEFSEKDFPDGIDTVPSCIRRLAELKIAEKSIVSLETNDLIILDGTLKAQIKEEFSFLNSLLDKAGNKNIITMGIAKTTNLLTDTGDSALPILSNLSQYGMWHYWPLYSTFPENHPAQMFISKLHPNSDYSFRIEIDKNKKSDINKIFSLLASNSTDPVFLGYPYGLIDADKTARVSNTEKEYLKTILKSKVKLKEYEAQQDAHDILDNIS